jgi:hypothetical protein
VFIVVRSVIVIIIIVVVVHKKRPGGGELALRLRKGGVDVRKLTNGVWGKEEGGGVIRE